MKKEFIYILVFYLILISTPVYSSDYFVNQNIGLDVAGAGCAENPWLTITYALSQVKGTSKNPANNVPVEKICRRFS